MAAAQREPETNLCSHNTWLTILKRIFTMKRVVLLLGLGLSLLACTRIEVDQEPESVITFTAYSNEIETKTERQENTDVYWCPGDAVSLFFNQGDHGGNRFVAQNTEIAAIAEFKGTITGFAGGGESTGGQFWFWGVYPFSEDNSCDGSSVTLTLPAQQIAKAGSFANGIFPTMARSKGLELGFYNICGGFKFTVSRDDIKSVQFRGNANEDLAGKARIEWDSNGHPAVAEHLAGNKVVTVTAPNNGTFVPGIEYYIVFFPELLSKGFTLTFITSAAKQGSFSYNQSRQLRRGIFINGTNLDTYVTSWTDVDDPSSQDPIGTEGGTESGLYLGISTFERYLTYYPTHLIYEETLESYNDIVDNLELTTLNGTALYYSIDEDITSMQSLTLPEDLFNVSIVTFTDGLDEGSLSYRRGIYKTKAEYLDALHTRLTNEQVSGLPIKSYAIGLKGTDAQSNLTRFRNNLEKIASTPANENEQYVYEISSINELNSSFASIADQLSQKIRVQKVIVSIPYPEDGERKRFTLDNKAPNQSTKYIEGVVDLDNLQLTNVVYQGLTSTSGDVVPISADYGFELEFTFDGIQTFDGTEIVQDNIQLWYIPAGGSSWQRNTEFSPSENSNVYTEQKSALVILNLDLSKSLEGQLPTLKSGAKSFLSRLYTASVDPDVIKRVYLNMISMDLIIGQSETLQVTISPSTASGNTLQWSSAIPSVATVNQNGKVTAVSEGTTIISVSTEDGREMATCTVTVRFQHVETISLDKTNLQLYVGKTATLAATVSPSNANNLAVTWSSSNPEVASVNENGVVTAISEGNATITASSVDGNKTATCAVSVVTFMPSSTPRDLTLAVSLPTGGRYFLQKDDLQYVNLDNYIVEGLYVVGLSAFIVALNDATTDKVCYDAANAFFCLPDGDQGMAISSRFSDINSALTSFGGQPIKSYASTGAWDNYYWTSEQGNSASSHKCIYGSGGSLHSQDNTNYYYVREVVPLSYESPWAPITPTTGLYLSVSNGSSRLLLKTANDIPAGYSPEGLAIESKSTKIIISLTDASTDEMNYSSASLMYSSALPNQDQGKLISTRFQDINRALSSFGGRPLKAYKNTGAWDNYYWTSQKGSSSTAHKCIYEGGGSLVDRDDSEQNYVRLIVDNNW